MNPGADVNAAVAVSAGTPTRMPTLDSAFAAVDRIIAEEKARAASMATPGATSPGDGSLAAPQPLAYPVLQPLPGADPNASIRVASDARPPFRPLRRAPLQRRVFLVPVGPVPPADIPTRARRTARRHHRRVFGDMTDTSSWHGFGLQGGDPCRGARCR